MKRADRADILIAALTVSLVAHAVLMIFIAPKVMSRMAGRPAGIHHREPMRVDKAVPSKEALKLELLADMPATRDAPVADISDLGMSAAFIPIPESDEGAAIPKPVVPGPDEAFASVAESAPVFADKVEVIERRQTVSPVVERLDLAPLPQTQSAPKIDGLVDSRPVPLQISVESVIASTPQPTSETVRMETRRGGSDDFKPSAEVYDEVDERIVEVEKAAVRRLVDSSATRDLAPGVDCRLTRQIVGEWTYFHLTVTPESGVFSTVPKDLVVLLDASGSIGTDRLTSCRSAARRILRSALNTGDRFNLVAFRDRFSYAFRSWQNCSAASYKAADRWLVDLAPFGRTDVFSTISSVLTLPRDPKRPIIAIVITDGDANAGVRETAEILSKFSSLNDGLVSVYMYGVKRSSNLELIDVLTRGNRGESVVHDGSRWKAGDGLEGLAERFRDPVLTDLRLVFSAVCPADTYPRMLKNLYAGGSLELVGRIPSDQGELAFSLRGQRAGTAFESFFRLPISSAEPETGLASRYADEAVIDMKLR